LIEGGNKEVAGQFVRPGRALMGEKLQMLGIATLGRRKWLLLTEVPGTDPAFSKDPVFSTLSSLRLGERLRIPGSKQNRQEKSDRQGAKLAKDRNRNLPILLPKETIRL
jgi:hypothetical protein